MVDSLIPDRTNHGDTGSFGVVSKVFGGGESVILRMCVTTVTTFHQYTLDVILRMGLDFGFHEVN